MYSWDGIIWILDYLHSSDFAVIVPYGNMAATPRKYNGVEVGACNRFFLQFLSTAGFTPVVCLWELAVRYKSEM